MVLLSGLPRDSAFIRAVLGENADWGQQEELLASIAELLDLSNRLFLQANSKPGTRSPKPIEIPRPYKNQPEQHQPTQQATREEIERFFTNIQHNN